MNIEYIEFKTYGDITVGNLSVIEAQRDLPFEIKRVYYIYGVPEKVDRGFHAHKALRQCLVCMNGRCTVTLDNGFERKSVLLDSPKKGLLIHPVTWREMTGFSENTVLAAFVSDYYSPEDYIRDYDEFLKFVRAK